MPQQPKKPKTVLDARRRRRRIAKNEPDAKAILPEPRSVKKAISYQLKKQLVQFNIPGMTAKQYDQAWEELRKAGHANPSGLIHHVSAQQGNNWVVVDVWESVEAFNKYGETLMPILGKLGVAKVQPVITPVHYEYAGVKSDPLRPQPPARP